MALDIFHKLKLII